MLLCFLNLTLYTLMDATVSYIQIFIRHSFPLAKMRNGTFRRALYRAHPEQQHEET